ncbi:MAG: bifunctional folylpolyglutamate synthase/dihydrofolate synthase [SAR202 cluster bacterium]|nr:bifunctional folylpolyglutamate synthase/dihydrofolate synthase [SAR202 cluster bacterium]|tara:strand:- start:8189 stop:9553 length:1365 start_codon:yes stop_codon:yes gene_type:complete
MRFDTNNFYKGAVTRLLSLADAERMAGVSVPEYKYDLERMFDFAQDLELMQPPHVTVHVAGTKGKGSVAAMIESMVRANGYRTGLYTSPHLHTFRERIKIDGVPVTEDLFAASLDRAWSYIESLNGSQQKFPTTFEMLTAMAMDLFKREQIDVAILEVGLGGRLDATNVFPTDVAVITSISLDHTAILGPTLSDIAHEKIGIVKRAQPVISAPQSPEAQQVIESKCLEVNAQLLQIQKDTTFQLDSAGLSGQKIAVVTPKHEYNCNLPLLGKHQAENAAVAITAVEQIPLELNFEQMVLGINSVKWDGRFQILSENPYLIVDGAHNPYSMQKLGMTIKEYFPKSNVSLIFGASMDKQLDLLISEAETFANKIYIVTSRHPRAASPSYLEKFFLNNDVNKQVMGEVKKTLITASHEASDNDVIVVTGSLFVVAEALEWYFEISPEWYPELSLSRS